MTGGTPFATSCRSAMISHDYLDLQSEKRMKNALGSNTALMKPPLKESACQQ